MKNKYLVKIMHETWGPLYLAVRASTPEKAVRKTPKLIHRTRMLDMDSISVVCEL